MSPSKTLVVSSGEWWPELWQQILRRFEEEAGDPPDAEPEDWELCLLARLMGEELPAIGRKGAAGVKRSLLRLSASPTGAELVSCERVVRGIAEKARAAEDCQVLLATATARECAGLWADARSAYLEVTRLGPAKPLDAATRFAQLLRVLPPRDGGGADACEAELRRALGPRRDGTAGEGKIPAMSEERRALLGRLVLLLCQEGREQEAAALLHDGGWRYRLAPWVLRYPLDHSDDGSGVSDGDVSFLRVFDCAFPEAMSCHLKNVFKAGSAFWSQHGYNEVAGSGESGYFSYLHPLSGPATSSMDHVLRYVYNLSLPHFPELKNATAAEWWAHCRPHSCGHQLHFDSDNEGKGGARHPIATSVAFLHAPPSFGGPTLVTDQQLKSSALAARGWLVYPRPGRLAVYDGTFLHGVIPGRGDPPADSPPGARRITFMVAFWADIESRPFGPDGLAGASRPLPDPAAPFSVGGRTYSWHQDLALLPGAREPEPPAEVRMATLPCRPGVWVAADGSTTSAADGVPEYDECHQF